VHKFPLADLFEVARSVRAIEASILSGFILLGAGEESLIGVRQK
jgi:hypothetical protein